MNTLKSKLYTLIKSQIGSEVLIFSDQNSTRPALPYWSIRVQSLRRLGKEYYSQGVTELGDQTITGVREATVAIQRYGDNSDIKCEELVDNLQKTTVIELFQAQKISCYETGDVMNISTVIDKSIIEPRAAVDLFIRFSAKIIDRVGIIDTVISSGDTNDDSISDVISIATLN